MMPPVEPLSWGAAWLLGLSMGLTGCAVACLPAMGGWVLGRAAGARAALVDAGAFAAGRLMGYTLLGGLAGGLGQVLLRGLESGVGHLWLAAGCLGGAAVLLRRPRSACGRARGRDVPPLLIGLGMALVPCAPLTALIAAAAAGGHVAGGLATGLAFGVGAAVTPVLLLFPALGGVARGMAAERAWLGRGLRLAGALLLSGLGLREILAVL